MKTILKDEEYKLEITDEGFDNPIQWLKLSISRRDSNAQISEVDIPLRDLMGALIGFDAKNNRFEDDVANRE